ncbi:MAG TPA: O-antigen ligase family protein, partial [Phycisphaerae bacterium]|nr:O-antigen ligase family protein [Phycisphaerae bacterium]
MLAIGQQKLDVLSLCALAVVVVAATVLSLVVPALMPWSFLALAGAGVLLYWSLRWEITLWTWVWILSYGLLDRPLWYGVMEGFFNLTIPRLIFAAAVVGFALFFLVRGKRLHFDRPILWAILALVAYVAVNASVAGWKTQIALQMPYYRFLVAMLFPFLMFFLVYNSVDREKQIAWALIPLSLYGWYALYIAYLQYAAIVGFPSARQFIWPDYINQPTWGSDNFGIHFDRARGAYTMVYPQAILLTLLFYADLLLIRKVRGGYRAALMVQAVLIPPAIFFTGLRAAYLAFLLCGVVWCLWGARGRLGKSKLALSALALGLAVIFFWSAVSSRERKVGGVGQVPEALARVTLARQALEVAAQNPLFGVGFGHFADVQANLQYGEGGTTEQAFATSLSQHNLLLVMLADTGVVGLALTLAVFYLVFRESRQLYRRISPDAPGLLCRPLVVLWWVMMVNYLTNAMFADPFWDIPSTALFWSLGAMIVAYNRLLKRQGAETPSLAASGA